MTAHAYVIKRAIEAADHCCQRCKALRGDRVQHSRDGNFWRLRRAWRSTDGGSPTQEVVPDPGTDFFPVVLFVYAVDGNNANHNDRNLRVLCHHCRSSAGEKAARV